jgi:VIT1/CCC1 family predicted Fe2+/Mn2+ transporter
MAGIGGKTPSESNLDSTLCISVFIKRPMSLRERTQVAKARMTDIQRMTAEQAETLKRLAKAAYDLQAFRPDLTRAEADQRIAMLKAKLKLESQPPHTE